jgi:hypothetical protein
MTKLQLEVTLRNNKTGETRVFKEEGWLEYKDTIVFFWIGGSFSCDCNRGLLWDGYPAEDDDEEDQYPCGDTKFTLLKLYLPETGETLFEELHDKSGV